MAVAVPTGEERVWLNWARLQAAWFPVCPWLLQRSWSTPTASPLGCSAPPLPQRYAPQYPLLLPPLPKFPTQLAWKSAWLCRALGAGEVAVLLCMGHPSLGLFHLITELALLVILPDTV